MTKTAFLSYRQSFFDAFIKEAKDAYVKATMAKMAPSDFSSLPEKNKDQLLKAVWERDKKFQDAVVPPIPKDFVTDAHNEFNAHVRDFKALKQRGIPNTYEFTSPFYEAHVRNEYKATLESLAKKIRNAHKQIIKSGTTNIPKIPEDVIRHIPESFGKSFAKNLKTVSGFAKRNPITTGLIGLSLVGSGVNSYYRRQELARTQKKV